MKTISQKLVKKDSFEKGVAMLELALTLPLFLTVLFGTLEYTHLLSAKDNLAFFTQVVGQKAFIDCTRPVVLTDPAADAVTRCLSTNVADLMREEILDRYPGAQVVVSVYRYNTLTSSVELAGYRVITREVPLCGDADDNDGDTFTDSADLDCQSSAINDYENINELAPSRYNLARVITEHGALITATNTLVIAEASLPKSPLVRGLFPFTTANWSSIYEISIF